MRAHGKQKVWESENILVSNVQFNMVQMRKLQFVPAIAALYVVLSFI